MVPAYCPSQNIKPENYYIWQRRFINYNESYQMYMSTLAETFRSINLIAHNITLTFYARSGFSPIGILRPLGIAPGYDRKNPILWCPRANPIATRKSAFLAALGLL